LGTLLIKRAERPDMNPFIVITGLLFLSISMNTPARAADTPPLPEIVCIQCHGAQSGRLAEPVKLWQGSIHAANGIACNDCHGGDPKDAANAMNPARGFLGAPKENDIPAFCGRCHVGVEKDYMQSAHGRALGKGGPTCVTCHGNHLVVKASLDIINEKRCGQCHGYEQARIIKEAMQQTEARILAIGARIELYKGEGVDTDKLEKGLFSVRNSFHTLFHNVNVELVNRESARFNTELNGIDVSLGKIAEERGKRKLAGAVVIGGALLAALIFHLLRKSYD
jgi:hypothetical protein